MEDRDKIDALREILSVKIQTLHILMTTGMTWWVSSVVFCGSILAGAWIKHAELAQLRFINWFCVIVLTFLLSIVIYGVWLANTFRVLCRDIKELRTGLAVLAGIDAIILRLRDHEYALLPGATLIGTSSFLLITMAWIGIWIFIGHL